MCLDKIAECFVLNPSVMLRIRSDFSLVFFHNGSSWSKLYNLPRKAGEIIMKLQTVGASAGELTVDLQPPMSGTLLDFLIKHRLIRPKWDNTFSGTRYHRQAEYFSQFANDPATSISNLRNSSVLLLGLGGVGCVVAQHLGAAGIGRLVVVDHDRVSATDLNRQFCYSQTDIGFAKPTVIEEYLRRYAPDTDVIAYDLCVNSRQKLETLIESEPTLQMIVCCADNAEVNIDLLVSEVCCDQNLPCTFAGLHATHGFWGPLMVTQEKIEAFRLILNSSREGWMDSAIPLCSAGHSNTTISALFTGDIIHYLAGCGPIHSANRILSFDFLSCSVREVLSL
jgi:hypothetical protein